MLGLFNFVRAALGIGLGGWVIYDALKRERRCAAGHREARRCGVLSLLAALAAAGSFICNGFGFLWPSVALWRTAAFDFAVAAVALVAAWYVAKKVKERARGGG